jgi:signal transduction histidine kinase
MLASDTSSASIVAAFDALPHAIFVVEALRAGHRNSYVNAAYAELTGYPAVEAVAAGFDALAIFADSDEVSTLAEAAEPQSTRVSLRRRDGTTVDAVLHLRTAPRAAGGGHVVGMLAPVAASSSPGSATNESAGRRAFLSWLNHELRSPLNACGMWLDVLALAPQPDKLGKAVDAIKRNLARQTRLVNDLNDAAKVSADGIELVRTPIDLAPLLERGLVAWQALALAKQVALEHRMELRADARLEGDAERLLQALNHVLETAIGSTPSGGRVELNAYEADSLCIVQVDDAGVALSYDDSAHLWKPLWRSPNSAKSRAGLGLGLAVAHHIVTQHGGSLTASSGKAGTRFVLTLPLAAGRR